VSGARTGLVTLDGAWGVDVNVPSNPAVAMCNTYNGAAIPSKAWADSLGRPMLMGFESSVDRAFSGAQGAQQDSPFSANRYDGWGYPVECGSWVCAHDGNSTPNWALANIEDYALTYALIQMQRGRSGPITGYGNPAAVEAFRRGVNRAGLDSPRWGVGTWGYGEGGGAYQLPPFADCEQLQSGNTPGPYPATDYNELYADIAVFRPYGLTVAPTPPPDSPPEESTMETVHGPYNSLMGDGRAILFGPDGEFLRDWFGHRELGRLNVAVDESPQGCPQRVIRSDDPNDPVWQKIQHRADNPPTGGGGGGVPIDPVALGQEIAKATLDAMSARLKS
jgi:hypothetical protein